jgi:phosphatidylglycerol lysyltransferase
VSERIAAFAGPIVGLALFAFAAWILHRELATVDYRDVLVHFRAVPPGRVALAFALTVAGYLALTGYDTLALRWLGRKLAYPRIALASFVAYVLSHNVGFAFLSGSAVRYRMFTSWGVPAAELARAITFNILTFWLGFLTVGGLVLTFAPLAVPESWHVPFATTRPIGVAFLCALGVYLAGSVRGGAVTLRGFAIGIPRPAMTLAQMALSSVDWLLAAGVLFVLLPETPGLGFPTLAGIFLLAQVAGLVSHVPAGLGVFETALVLLLSPWLPGDVVLGSALAYRIVYYLIPLGIALLLFAGFEALERRTALRAAGDWLEQSLQDVVPRFFAAAAFAAGAMLLLSVATPGIPSRMEWLEDLLPLPLLELSHFLASAAGVALLLLARALQQRVDAAWGLTIALLLSGAVASLAKGLDFEEASVLTAMAAGLLLFRRAFYRRSSLLAQTLAPASIAGVALCLVGAGFVVAFAYREVGYAQELWWQFAFDAHAPRSLRALAGGAIALAALSAARLLRPAPPLDAPDKEAIARVLPLVAAARHSSAHLALLGDKRILFHESGTGFLMYGVQRRSFVAMGDPVGPKDVRRELAWEFRELADRHGSSAVFYEVGAEDLPIYLELGLRLRKLGEEARVPLADFSLAGGARKGLRAAHNRAIRDGCRFEIVAPGAVGPLLPELRAVSDEWLRSKRTREKRFSLGAFDEDYLARCPLAVVRHAERIAAFANVWAPVDREEASVDLMRHADAAPPGVMDFLFVELLLWAQHDGYRFFSLGMAPLAGFEHHRLAPLWNRLGALLFRHGEQFYNFRGLRSFKDKFDPVWEPRFLASPGGIAVPFVLTDVAALISGGVTGVVTR